MQDSSCPRSPSFIYSSSSSPPWSPFHVASPIPHSDQPPAGFSTAESSLVPNEASMRSSCIPVTQPSSWAFPSLPTMTGHQNMEASCSHAQETNSLPSQLSAFGSQTWQMQQSEQCIDVEDNINLGQEVLEASVMVFDESVREPQPAVDVQDSQNGVVKASVTGGSDDNGASLDKLGSEPYIGLQFGSEGEAYEYYKAYGKAMGFSIRRNRVQRSRVDHSVISREYVCAKQGFRSLKDKRYKGRIVRPRQETRVDCRAAMSIKKRSGKWVVYQFHKEHNHDLVDSAKDKLQSHWKMTNTAKSMFRAPYKIQCFDMQGNISFGEEILEADVLLSDESTRDPQSTLDMQQSEMGDVNTAETSGMEDYNVQEFRKEGQTAETSGREEDNPSLTKLVSEPYIGLRFCSEDEAYEYYNAYAKEKGFSIRRNRIQRSRADHSVISREYVCANQGFRKTNDKRYKGKVVRSRRETRVDCRAAMSIKKRSGKWIIDQFHREHNHDLVDSAKADKLRSHRKVTKTTKSIIEALTKCGIGASEITGLLTEARSEEIILVGNVEQQGENYIRKERKNNIRVECYHLVEYLQGLQAVDPGFFYAVEFDENRCMRSIFWVDGKARQAYKQFGDVLVFDTVCRTNKYLFPLASFTGVNHHKQSLLFGCGFLADETIESFVWLFETWLRAMSDQQPTSIITNQDKAMKVAIEKVFPETRHRFCMLQIEKDELENLSHVFNRHKDFQAEYRKCIFSKGTPEEFESDWEALTVKYNLKENRWLSRLYNQRHHWVPLYLQDTFFAGLTTTQRSESVNSYFYGFLHQGTPFSEFVPQYERAVKRHHDEEADEDFLTVFTRAVLRSKNPMEEQASRIYTRNVFTVFGHEFLESSGCIAQKIGAEGSISKYLVGKYNDMDGKMDIVTFNPIDNSTRCSCRMFEFEGLLCRHVLKVFQMVNIFEIPHQYILKRWTMSAKYAGLCNNEAGGCSQDVTKVNLRNLKENTKRFVDLSANSSPERIGVATRILLDGFKELSLISVPTTAVHPENLLSNSIILGENVDDQSETIRMMDLNVTVHDGPQVNTKVRSLSRMNFSIEHIQKKKRTCNACKEIGHYARTCPKGPVDQSQTSELLQRPVDQSHTSTVLQGPFSQHEIFAML
ncbi:zinc finger protein [Macleaya cordata]|uniref:Zinc finger protein n=1 Tax=Macleaya cordata TaxID=56857 RepID=A0A200QLG0_MACCD|nr:zinc finger protein [Macleaya cordata]